MHVWARIFLLLGPMVAALQAKLSSGEPLVLEVRETAGIQRFAYPVAAEVSVSGNAAGFQLYDGERPLVAQFTRLDAGKSGQTAPWSVDFNVDLLPLEARRLTIEQLDQARPAVPPRRRLSVDRTGGQVRVAHPTLEFLMAENLQGLLQAIRVSGDDFLLPGSRGLVVYLRDGREMAVGHLAAASSGSLRVTKSGPLAAALEYTCGTASNGADDATLTVTLDFPLGKSWVRTDCALKDPANRVSALGVELRLRLEPKESPPVLADVGAAGWTYAALRPEETLLFCARPARTVGAEVNDPLWSVDRVLAGRATAYARPSQVGSDRPQGWAHLMDSKRTTAVAVANFARGSTDMIELAADGRLRLRREFAGAPNSPGPNKKQLTFWLHVVSTPPQRGAVTSPQSMLAPPEVRVVDPDVR